MHFSMAVSLLAQSLPLALGYRAGWRKREKSESQSGILILQAALYEEFRDKKDVVPEKKRAGSTHPVQNKQGTVLEKERSGTVRPEQGSVSSEIPSDDQETSVECDPLSKAPDAGIFACDVDSHCVKSEESELGGFCVAFEQAPILSRAMQSDSGFNCTDPNEAGWMCDCSLFNNTSGVGSYTCTSPEGYCVAGYPTVCGSFEIMYTIIDNSVNVTYCIEPDGGVPMESLCYYVSYDNSSFLYWECEFKVNDIMCNSCTLEDCFGNRTLINSIFDCTNTVVNVQGNTCETGLLGSFFNVSETGMPSSAPLETPSASPVESPAPTTSSGSTRTAKVAIIVSVAGAALLASFVA